MPGTRQSASAEDGIDTLAALSNWRPLEELAPATMMHRSVAGAASKPYTLEILSWIGVFFLPLVVLYQSWSYWVFRRRVTRAHVS